MKYSQLKIRYSENRDSILLVNDNGHGVVTAVDVTDEVLNAAVLFVRQNQRPRETTIVERFMKKLGLRVVVEKFRRVLPGSDENSEVAMYVEYKK